MSQSHGFSKLFLILSSDMEKECLNQMKRWFVSPEQVFTYSHPVLFKSQVPKHNFTSTVRIKLPQRCFYSKFAGISGNLQAGTTLVYIQHSQLPSITVTLPATLSASLVVSKGQHVPDMTVSRACKWLHMHTNRAFLLAAQCLQAPAA